MKTFITLVAAALVMCANPNARATDAALSEPAKSILDHYTKIHAQLTKDSIRGVAAHATAIATAAKGDDAKTLPAEVAPEAEALAKAKDLAAAREAFKPLSDSLIKYMDESKAGKGAYHHAYCPMAKASWLQTGKDIKNPYMGKDMLDCGELKD